MPLGRRDKGDAYEVEADGWFWRNRLKFCSEEEEEEERRSGRRSASPRDPVAFATESLGLLDGESRGTGNISATGWRDQEKPLAFCFWPRYI